MRLLFYLLLTLLARGAACDRPEVVELSNQEFPENSSHGYISIDNKGNDLFYWFFPSRGAPATDPLVVWFTGGPGCSSALALLTEVGPFKMVSGKLVPNEYSWNSRANLLFIDNPIGTGMSHSSLDDRTQTEFEVVSHMRTFFRKWIRLEAFSFLQRKPIFITGESYAGHYIPFIGNGLRTLRDELIQVKGVAIGNGMVASGFQFVSYVEYSKLHMQETSFTAQKYATYKPLMQLCESMMRASPKPLHDKLYPFCWSTVKKMISDQQGQKLFNWYDITKPCVGPLCYDFGDVSRYMNSYAVLRLLNSDKPWRECDDDVGLTLARLDWIRDCRPELESLLESGVKVLGYYGDLDWVVNYVGGLDVFRSLRWAGSAEFSRAAAQDYLGGVGTLYQARNLQFVQFFGAGHMVPMDKPENSLKMLTDFIGGSSAAV